MHEAKTDTQTHESVWEGIGMLLLVMIGFYVTGKSPLASIDNASADVAGLGGVFAAGLLASVSSCLALVGGLLLSVSATYASSRGKEGAGFTPALQFNIGRLAGYVLLGGLVGLLGHALTLSTRSTGILSVVLAVVMLSMGLSLLRILPKNVCRIPLPASWVKALRSAARSDRPFMPLLLGALTFFIPCGFTQAMQLLALASGNFVKGSLIMGTFALGTLPALLGIGTISAVSNTEAGRAFLRFSGAVVVVLGVMSLSNGLVLSGVNVNAFMPGSGHALASKDPNVTIDSKGNQIISLRVSNSGYSPTNVTIDPGKETWVYATAQGRQIGCTSVLTAPAYNLSTPIIPGGNWLGPIKDPTKDFLVACSIGRYRTTIHVRS